MTISLWTGGVTPTGWKATARTTAASVRLAISTSSTMLNPTYLAAQAPVAGVAAFTVTGRTADTDYWCAVEEDGTLDTFTVAHVRTFPPAGSQASFRITAGSCAGATTSQYLHSFAVSNAPIFDTVRDTKPLLFCHLGDMHYRNITANDPQAFRDAYDAVLAAPRQAALYRSAPLAYVWDDHDFSDNDSDGTRASRPAVSAVYRERIPSYAVPAGPDAPIYQAWTIGRVQFVMSDTRHDRVPSTQPDGPSKTMLGATQKAWMRSVLTASTSELLVWLNPTPWMGYSADTWAGYAAERDELAAMFADTGWTGRMVCITGDYHGLGMDTGGGNQWGGFPVYLWCSMDSPTTGTPTTQYDMGPTSIGADRYGTLDVADFGDYLRVTGTGYIGTEPWRQHTFYVTTTEAASPPRGTVLTYDDTLARVRIKSAETSPAPYEALSDTFGRTATNGWGTADTGQTWTVSGDVASAFSVAGNVGKVTGTGATGARRFVRTGSYGDVDLLGTVRVPLTPTGGGINSGLIARSNDDNNAVLAWVSFNTTGTLQLSLYKRVAGTFTSLGQVTLTDTFDPAAPMWIRLDATGDAVSAKAWKNGAVEPGAWQVTASLGGDLAAPGGVGVYSTIPATNTNGTVAIEFDNLKTTEPPHVYLDVERSTNQITWAAVRGGTGIDTAPGQTITVDDYEFTPDVPNYYRVTVRDLPVGGDVLDDSIAVTTPTMTSVWLKSASRPFLNRPVAVVDMSAVTRASRGATFDVIARKLPVSVTGVRGSRTFDLTVLTDDESAAAALDVLLSLGEPVLVHVPQACPLAIPTLYAMVGDVSTDQPSRDTTIRVTTLPLTEVAPPGPDVIGATVTWASIANDYATWSDLAADLATWGDVLNLIGDPADVVVE